MIAKLKLKDIYNDTFRRSTLISIPNLDELFEVPNSKFSKYQVFYTIVKDAVLKFSHYYPLVVVQRMFIEVDSTTRKAQIKPNFEAYLKGIIQESAVVLQPQTVTGIAINGYVGGIYPMRNFRFQNGEFWDFWYTTGVYFGNCICQYPMHEEYIESSKEYADNCAVYYLNQTDSTYRIFRDEVYIQTCRYIMNIKKNMNLPNMPIELFQGLEEDYSNINSQLERIYDAALPASPWLI